ncbi:hypothetical protein JXA34_03400 [Patescibacteria group bacterium]|nr:hypothetical protein [Patescibacteria group bacterium]
MPVQKREQVQEPETIRLGRDVKALGLPGYVEAEYRRVIGDHVCDGMTKLKDVADGREVADLGLLGLTPEVSDIIEKALGRPDVQKTNWVSENLGESWGEADPDVVVVPAATVAAPAENPAEHRGIFHRVFGVPIREWL